MFYFIYLFTGLLISSFIHLLIDSIAHSLVRSPAHFVAQSLITFLICPLTLSLIYSLHNCLLAQGQHLVPGLQEVPSPCAFCDFSLPEGLLAWRGPPPQLPRPQQDAPLLVKVHPSCPPGLREQAWRDHIGPPCRVWWGCVLDGWEHQVRVKRAPAGVGGSRW